MWKDKIVEQIRKFRDDQAKKFDYDLEAICRDAKERETKSGRKVIPPPTKRKASVAS